jgi:hypothetical protein
VAKRFGRWQVKDGQGSVQPPSTPTTTKPRGSSTTTTTKG